MKPLRFTLEDADRAHNEWGANCGPGAIAAILGLSLDELRPQMGKFEAKGYTNPGLMWFVLQGLGVTWRRVEPPRSWPDYGLALVQWEGPWTKPGVPPHVADRHTHWVGARWLEAKQEFGIFDINCMNSGGWVSDHHWVETIVPWLLSHNEPKSTGGWHLTHVVEVEVAA